MVNGINLQNVSLPLQATNSPALSSNGDIDQPDFHGELGRVFSDVTSRLQEVPGMQGVFCIQPPSQIDITVVDPQSIPGDNSASSIV